MESIYEPINFLKEPALFSTKFSVEKSNKIITGLVEKIKNQCKGRCLNISFKRSIERGGERIRRVDIESRDGVIKGYIIYNPVESVEGYVCGGDIEGQLNFNSSSRADKEEYLGLAKILHRI
jgi:hypothetical protein